MPQYKLTNIKVKHSTLEAVKFLKHWSYGVTSPETMNVLRTMLIDGFVIDTYQLGRFKSVFDFTHLLIESDKERKERESEEEHQLLLRSALKWLDNLNVEEKQFVKVLQSQYICTSP